MEDLPDEKSFTNFFAEQSDMKILQVLSQDPTSPVLPRSKPYPPSLVLKMRCAMWSEMRFRVRRNPHLAGIFRNLWATTMERSRSSDGNSISTTPQSSASSSPNCRSIEDSKQKEDEEYSGARVDYRSGTRRKGQPQKILPTTEALWESGEVNTLNGTIDLI